MIQLSSPYSIKECIARIESSTDPDIFFNTPGDKRIIAKINTKKVRLRKRRSYLHAFAPKLYCKFNSENHKTVIYCYARIKPVVKLFLIIWSAVAIIMCTIIFIWGVTILFGTSIPLQQSNDIGSPFAMIIFPIIFLGLSFGMVYSGKLLGKKEIPMIEKYLIKTLQAKELTEN